MTKRNTTKCGLLGGCGSSVGRAGKWGAIAYFAAFSPVVCAVPAFAQSSEAVAPTGSGDIIVTARKREESILKVPVVVNVVTGKTLDTLQVTEVTDLPRLVPSLFLGANLLSIGPQVTLRGIGTSSSDPGVDQSVSLNIDGMSLGHGLAYASGMFDVGQVEVLKGPQALFFGKSSPGGVISIRTADPTDKAEVVARAGYEFDSRAKRGELILSGPLSETLGGRFATTYSAADGYFKNVAVPIVVTGAQAGLKRESRPREFVARGTLLWKPTDAFSARLKFTHAYNKATHPENPQLKYCPEPGQAFGAGPLAPVNPIPIIAYPCKLDRIVHNVYADPNSYTNGPLPNDGKPTLRSDQNYGVLELKYAVTPELDLSSTTGYYHLKSSSLFGRSEAAAPFFAVTNQFRRREFTQEVRLNSDFSSPFNFTLGAFHENGTMYDRVVFHRSLIYAFIPTSILSDDRATTVHIKTDSLFGQLRYKLSDRLELAGGVRWTNERRNEEVFDFQHNVDITSTLPIPKISASNFSPEATITYTPSDDVTLFSSYKKGYKSGSFKISVPAVAGEDNSFGDERVQGYEVGLKSRLLDRRLLLNLAFYDYYFKGLQVGGIVPSNNGVPVIKTVNAGKARSYGVDLDVAYHPGAIEGLTLNAAIGWNKARYIVLNNIGCYTNQTIAMGCVNFPNPQTLDPATGLPRFTAQELSGTQMVRAPEWSGNIGFSYEMPIGSGLRLQFTNNNQFSSKYPTFPAIGVPNNTDFQNGFVKVDANLTLKGPEDRWEIALIGRNIGEKITASTCYTNNGTGQNFLGGNNAGGVSPSAAGLPETGCYTDAGRQIWVRLTWRPFN